MKVEKWQSMCRSCRPTEKKEGLNDNQSALDAYDAKSKDLQLTVDMSRVYDTLHGIIIQFPGQLLSESKSIEMPFKCIVVVVVVAKNRPKIHYLGP